ncbi:hypothetical protein LJB63_20445, partial [[Eubacterium] rectale]|nr:hypothetical protein [Agathobacter rectalis]
LVFRSLRNGFRLNVIFNESGLSEFLHSEKNQRVEMKRRNDGNRSRWKFLAYFRGVHGKRKVGKTGIAKE